MKKIVTHSNIIFWFILILTLSSCYYLLFRNTRVLSYRNQLSVQQMFVDIGYHDEFKTDIYDRYTYLDMLFSFKPLESKYWYSDEEISKYHLELVDEASKFYLFK